MPQPIDMQTELARALIADRIQQGTERAAMAAALRARQKGEEQEAVGETQVDDTPESQSEHIDPEMKRRNSYMGRRRKGNQQQDESNRNSGEKTRPAGPEDHNFDVSV